MIDMLYDCRYAVVKESDVACFNGAVSSAVSYCRHARLKQDTDRVMQLGTPPSSRGLENRLADPKEVPL